MQASRYPRVIIEEAAQFDSRDSRETNTRTRYKWRYFFWFIVRLRIIMYVSSH